MRLTLPETTYPPSRAAAGLVLLRTPAVYAIEIATIVCSAVLAFLLRFDLSLPPYYVPALLSALAVWIPVKLVAFKLLGLDRRWARYVSLADLTQFALSNFLATLVSLIVLQLEHRGVPRSVYFIDFLLCLILTMGTRASVRLVFESTLARRPASGRKRTLIYGAGSAGASLVRDLRQNALLNYDVCGLIDDNPQKRGLVLHGVKVLGSGRELADLIRTHRVELLLIAMPAVSGAQLTDILERCNNAGVPYKTIPGLAEIIGNNGLAGALRDVAVEDLLGRRPVSLDQQRVLTQLGGRVVLVTGAAGSIGSEICRQVARFHPAALVAFEIAESPLFSLQQELRRTFPDLRFEAEIGSIQNPARLREVFDRYRPAVVYHAAAYKHVPLMEAHVFEAVENNVFGTLNLIHAARDFHVAEFVMISSDKAVRPANVMGATKRVAELLVRALGPADGRYVSVRFGNVLGSNGSVVPIFKDQIARGGPVTVTHPDMRRFFMTIPEACQLVLQASTMGKGGEVFVLDMGKPVKIVDLARNLILLSGLRPDVDIKIEFSGVRPGEKLFEELSEMEEGLLETHHEKISIFAGATRPLEEIEWQLGRLRSHCVARNVDEVIAVFRTLVPEYTPGDSFRRNDRAAEGMTAGFAV